MSDQSEERESYLLCVSDEDAGVRIDRYLSEASETFTRSYLQKLIKNGQITVNGRNIKPSYQVNAGDQIQITEPEKTIPDILPENIPLDIVYEDEDVILINKPKNMVVHPAAGHYSGTIVNALMYHCPDSLSGINGVMRPGIVHRIDMNTTGIIIVCKNDKSHQAIAAQLKEHSITRRYYAICYGNLAEDELTVNAPIGRNPNDRKKMAINYDNGKEAITHVKVLERFGSYTWIECRLETGRTHQIRVHMASIGHPLLGDDTYSTNKLNAKFEGQTLHAFILGFIHPTTGEYMEFTAELPQYFAHTLTKLREGKTL